MLLLRLHHYYKATVSAYTSLVCLAHRVIVLLTWSTCFVWAEQMTTTMMMMMMMMIRTHRS